MKRAIARHQTLWMRLFLIVLVLSFLPLGIPYLWSLLLTLILLILAMVRAPRSGTPAVTLAPPVTGRWVAVNSPGTAVPSHGIRAYGQAYAVDMLMPSPDAATKISWSFTTRDPSSYPCFGAPVLAMAAGRVVRATGGQRDHRSRDTWPALIWMMTAEGLARELAGAHRILGNRVIIEHDDGTYAVYAHLRQSSLTVAEGDRVTEGQQLAEVGNTGNTSEPHLHVQLVDSPHPTATAGIPMHWPTLHVLADKAPRWTTGDPKPSALPGYLESGHVFETHPAHTAPGTP